MGENTNHVSDEGLAHKICKEFLHTAKKKKNPLKMSRGSEDIFPKSI